MSNGTQDMLSLMCVPSNHRSHWPTMNKRFAQSKQICPRKCSQARKLMNPYKHCQTTGNHPGMTTLS
jgi:hypothetical protein